jgi:hypothetical protein
LGSSPAGCNCFLFIEFFHRKRILVVVKFLLLHFYWILFYMIIMLKNIMLDYFSFS